MDEGRNEIWGRGILEYLDTAKTSRKFNAINKTAANVLYHQAIE
jgi:hypothetical protein